MAIWLDSLNIEAYRHLCQAYEELGDYDSAVEIYEKLIQIMPNMPEVHSNLANILYIKGDIEGAISHFQTAVTLNPRKQWTSIINQTLGFVYQESKNDLNAAIKLDGSSLLYSIPQNPKRERFFSALDVRTIPQLYDEFLEPNLREKIKVLIKNILSGLHILPFVRNVKYRLSK